MPVPTERTALEDLYDTTQTEIPLYIQQLYPPLLRYWQYLGTGVRNCRWEGPGYVYVSAEDPDWPLNYELKIRRHRVQSEVSDIRTALYRLHNRAGELLYVGISAEPLRRWPEHAADKPWWPDVANFSLEWFESRPAALQAEARAIRTEHPLYNVVHNGDAKPQ